MMQIILIWHTALSMANMPEVDKRYLLKKPLSINIFVQNKISRTAYGKLEGKTK